MPEADADHLAVLGSADELQQRLDPRQRIVDARRRSGDQLRHRERPVRATRRPARRSSRSRTPARACLEHRRIVAELVGERCRAGGRSRGSRASWRAALPPQWRSANASERGCDDRQTAGGTSRADHRRRHRHRRRRREHAACRRARSLAARPPARTASGRRRASSAARPSAATSPTPSSIHAAFDEARAVNGPIDLLIVNAGIAESAPFHKMTRESWDRIIAVPT